MFGNTTRTLRYDSHDSFTLFNWSKKMLLTNLEDESARSMYCCTSKCILPVWLLMASRKLRKAGCSRMFNIIEPCVARLFHSMANSCDVGCNTNVITGWHHKKVKWGKDIKGGTRVHFESKQFFLRILLIVARCGKMVAIAFTSIVAIVQKRVNSSDVLNEGTDCSRMYRSSN